MPAAALLPLIFDYYAVIIAIYDSSCPLPFSYATVRRRAMSRLAARQRAPSAADSAARGRQALMLYARARVHDVTMRHIFQRDAIIMIATINTVSAASTDYAPAVLPCYVGDHRHIWRYD